MRIASLVGALALSAAVFLFFYRIWGLLATPWQVGIVVAAPLIGVGLTEMASRTDTTRHFVFIAALIAAAAIVLNVIMLGDIFAISDSPNALLAWAVFALAMGYAYGLRLLVAAGLALAMAFVAGSNLAWRGIDWMSFAERPEAFLLIGPVVFAIGASTSAGGARRFAPTYRIVGLCTLLVTLWALSIDASLSVLHWHETPIKALYQILGFACSAAAVATGIRSDWSETTNIGAAGFVVLLYTKFYQWWWDWMPAYLFFFVVGLISMTIILVLRRLRAVLQVPSA